MPAVSPVVYNHANLSFWQQELPQVQSQISETSHIIDGQKRLLEPLQRQLESIDRLISITQNQLVNLNISSTQDMIHHMHDHHDRHHHHHGDGFLHYASDFAREWNRSQLQQELGRLQNERSLVRNQMRPYEHVINEAQARLQQLYARQSFLNQHIPGAELFLHRLQENPLALVNTLAEELHKAFMEYEDTYLTNLSVQTRISLLAARYGLNELIRADDRYNPESSFMQPAHRANYLRLCGFIWDMYSRVRQEGQNSAFEHTLAKLVACTHVQEEGDLPDLWQTGFSARAWFDTTKNTNLPVFAIQPQQLAAIEEQLFNNGLEFLQHNNAGSNQLQHHILQVTQLIKTEVALKKHQQKAVDYHFYERTIGILNNVLQNPVDVLAAKRLGDIAAYASGSPSVGRQVAGGLLIALGILLIGASIAGLVATLGSTSALSAVGVALGVSLLQAQVVVGVSSTLAAATGVGLTFFTGPAVLKSGQRQGLSQGLVDVKEDVEQAVATYH